MSAPDIILDILNGIHQLSGHLEHSGYTRTSYNQGALRPDGGALRAPLCAVIIRALRALMAGRRATRACAAIFSRISAMKISVLAQIKISIFLVSKFFETGYREMRENRPSKSI